MILKKEDETNETLFVWCYLWTSACKDRWVRRARKDRQMWGGEHRGWWKESVIEGRGGGIFVRSLNGQSVPTETGSNVRSAMKWPPSRLLSLSSECVSVSVCVGLFSPKTSPKISEHILSLWECFPFFSLFKIAPVVQLEAAFQSWWDHES